MKRIIYFILAVTMIILGALTAGCGSSSSNLTGTWIADEQRLYAHQFNAMYVYKIEIVKNGESYLVTKKKVQAEPFGINLLKGPYHIVVEAKEQSNLPATFKDNIFSLQNNHSTIVYNENDKTLIDTATKITYTKDKAKLEKYKDLETTKKIVLDYCKITPLSKNINITTQEIIKINKF